jgi:hypothetical protein
MDKKTFEFEIKDGHFQLCQKVVDLIWNDP